jgi:hypothetical protein
MTMLRDWLLDEPPRQLQELQRITGLSYPTVSTAVEQLGRWIRRGRYRTVALDQFPWEIWEKLVVQGNEARETVRFIDETGLGRSPSQLVERLSQLNVDVAIGGVAGARHYDHDMDLAGNPRLDLTIHQERGELATSWVKMIDPALERTDSGYQSASVLVHVLRRHDSLFDSNQLGQKIADPAECLLDLVDLRLDDQARRFADHFNKKIPIR